LALRHDFEPRSPVPALRLDSWKPSEQLQLGISVGTGLTTTRLSSTPFCAWRKIAIPSSQQAPGTDLLTSFGGPVPRVVVVCFCGQPGSTNLLSRPHYTRRVLPPTCRTLNTAPGKLQSCASSAPPLDCPRSSLHPDCGERNLEIADHKPPPWTVHTGMSSPRAGPCPRARQHQHRAAATNTK
jgi:hypothetical protein